MQRPSRGRGGFTLIELLVAMSIIVLLAGLTLAFLPGVQDQQRAARGATMLQGWLNIAKQKAFRERAPRGLRFLNKNGNGLINEFQYLEVPDDFHARSVPNGCVLWNALNNNSNALEVHITNADLLNGYGSTVADQPFWTVQPGDYLEIMGVGTVHRISGVKSATSPSLYSSILLASAADPFIPTWKVYTTNNPTGGTFTLKVQVNSVWTSSAAIPYDASPAAVKAALEGIPSVGTGNVQVTGSAGGPWRITFMIPIALLNLDMANDPSGLALTGLPLPAPVPDVGLDRPNPIPFYYFRIIRAPRVAGDEQLQLPDNIAVDLRTNFLSTGTSFDTDTASQYQNKLPMSGIASDLDIMFSPSGAVITPGIGQDFLGLWVRDVSANTVFEVGPTILGVHVRTGLIAAHPPNDSGTDPYTFVKDGRVN